MGKISLANKYRPKTFEDVSEQDSIKVILENQIKTNDVKHAYLFCGGAGTGKAQPLDSDILTINGYVKMRDIQLGTSLIDGMGNECKVIGIYPQGKQAVYKVTFSDRTSTLCSDEHLWKVGSYKNSKKEVVWSVKTAKELFTNGVRKRNGKGGLKYRIPVPTINCWQTSNFVLEPYLLGVLLGDGSLTGKSIDVSIYEEDIYNKVNSILNSMGYKLSKKSSNPTIKDYSIVQNIFTYSNQVLPKTGFKQYIDELNLNCKSIEKHIPKQYLYTVVENRIKLLQGLIDTDGYVDKNGLVYFYTSSKQLSEDFAFLVRSLGGTDTIVKKQGKYCKKGHHKEYVKCNEYYVHNLKFNNNFPFCSSKKHLAKIKQRQFGPMRRIVKIEYVGEQECQCIKVSSPDETYITNDLIVTHNTTTARIIASMINEGKGIPIEMDCASHNGVDDMRMIQEECKSKPLVGKYKIFILDECHSLTVQAWNSMLKILEEPPEFVVFMFCTTDPQKILATILSRVQRFNFSRISVQGIVNRLKYIINQENNDFFNDPNVSEEEYNARQIAEAQGAVYIDYEEEAIEYIARLAKGGMRDSITTLEKCLDYSKVLTLENVLKVTSGGVTEDTLRQFLQNMLNKDCKTTLLQFNDIYMSGVDVSLFLKLYIEFLENCVKFIITQSSVITTLSPITIQWLQQQTNFLQDIKRFLLSAINITKKYSSEDLKIMVESWVIQECS